VGGSRRVAVRPRRGVRGDAAGPVIARHRTRAFLGGADDRRRSSVGMGARPAEFHEKPGQGRSARGRSQWFFDPVGTPRRGRGGHSRRRAPRPWRGAPGLPCREPSRQFFASPLCRIEPARPIVPIGEVRAARRFQCPVNLRLGNQRPSVARSSRPALPRAVPAILRLAAMQN
jgi:hypothetical protein